MMLTAAGPQTNFTRTKRELLRQSLRRSLLHWVEELRSVHEGVPLASRGRFPMAGAPGVLVTYSDASGGHGFGAWTLHQGVALYVCEEWEAEERVDWHINLKELFAMSVALATFLPITGATHVAEFTDNTAAEGAARERAAAAVRVSSKDARLA